MNIEQWEENVIYEQADIKTRVIKLRRFMETSDFIMKTDEEKRPISAQLQAMENYLSALSARVDQIIRK